MIKEFIGTGKTIEEASLSARAGLNAPATADVKIEVIQMPKKKVLGLFGGADAKVKAWYDDGRKEKKPQQKKKAQAPAQKKPKNEKKTESKPDKKPEKKANTHAPVKEDVKTEKAEEMITEKDVNLDYVCSYVKTILDGLKVEDAKLSARVENGVVEVDIDCDDYGIIIGRRGETLDAIQYLTSLAIKNITNKYVRVSLNVGDYRAKREETLKALAIKNANFVVRTGRRYVFEPMNPYERRIIHTAVQEVEGAVSRSVGNGMDRKVIIEPEGGVKHSYNRGGSQRRGGSRRSQQSAPAVDPNREKKVDRADIPKFGKIEVNKED
ncbi:MAG: RNA-binding cell elongation regulator Jag/EloR [Eubacterium sp.]